MSRAMTTECLEHQCEKNSSDLGGGDDAIGKSHFSSCSYCHDSDDYDDDYVIYYYHGEKNLAAHPKKIGASAAPRLVSPFLSPSPSSHEMSVCTYCVNLLSTSPRREIRTATDRWKKRDY